jgi:hypothetical protein
MTDRAERTGSTAFAVAAAVMVTGVVSEELMGLTDLDVWPWAVAAGLSISMGVLRLGRRIEPAWPGLAKRVRLSASVAAAGSTVYVVTTLSHRAADVTGLTFPEPLQGLFVVSALAFLVGSVLATVLVGGGGWRTRAISRDACLLLMALGILLPIPLVGLLGADAPSRLPVVHVLVLALLTMLLAGRVSAHPRQP